MIDFQHVYTTEYGKSELLRVHTSDERRGYLKAQMHREIPAFSLDARCVDHKPVFKGQLVLSVVPARSTSCSEALFCDMTH